MNEAGRLVAQIGRAVVARGGNRLAPQVRRLTALYRAALAEEIALRRPFLWRAVAAGAGVSLYFAAAREPPLPLCLALAGLGATLAYVTRAHPRARTLFLTLTFIALGFTSGAWRTARVKAPIVPRVGIGELTGFVEEIDPRRNGARFILRLASAEGLPNDVIPARVRLTTRDEPVFAAGDFIALKARLMPPARAALPGGYDFARDAFFIRLGGVGSVLGKIEILPPPDPAPLDLRFFAAVDRLRNDLAQRVYGAIGGDAGAIAAAMVAGKRDFLSQDARTLIRRAGIFHIVTISGVQMTLVSGIFYVGLRRLLALSQTLALNYPIHKWAAALAILGAIIYDLGTGSRVGTQRALAMTAIMLGAAIVDRPSLSMRNLALAAFCVIAFEPEALLGASFQLSFAAVAALIAVYEWRNDYMKNSMTNSAANLMANSMPDYVAGSRAVTAPSAQPVGAFAEWREIFLERLLHGPGALLLATLCATSAAAAFMAADFHEISPYVLIGNPLTLAIIEFFAVPCALLGALLYPLGLDGFVWFYLKLGIDLVMWLAGLIAAAPGASLPVKAFAPWALVFLSLAVLSAVLWRSWPFKATALPFLLVGLIGARDGAAFDIAIAPTGDAVALRQANGALALIGMNPQAFAAEQWLRADADPRAASDAAGGGCDALACVGRAIDGSFVSVVTERAAFVEDCARAAMIVTPLRAPTGCAAPIVIDRDRLAETGAITLRFRQSQDEAQVEATIGPRVDWTMARENGEDRPWSPKPETRRKAVAPSPSALEAEDAPDDDDPS